MCTLEIFWKSVKENKKHSCSLSLILNIEVAVSSLYYQTTKLPYLSKLNAFQRERLAIIQKVISLSCCSLFLWKQMSEGFWASEQFSLSEM